MAFTTDCQSLGCSFPAKVPGSLGKTAMIQRWATRHNRIWKTLKTFGKFYETDQAMKKGTELIVFTSDEVDVNCHGGASDLQLGMFSHLSCWGRIAASKTSQPHAGSWDGPRSGTLSERPRDRASPSPGNHGRQLDGIFTTRADMKTLGYSDAILV